MDITLSSLPFFATHECLGEIMVSLAKKVNWDFYVYSIRVGSSLYYNYSDSTSTAPFSLKSYSSPGLASKALSYSTAFESVT